MEENKKNYALWLYPETVRRMDSSLELANCQSRSEFVEKALHFYMGYLVTDDTTEYLSKALLTSLRGMLDINDDRMRSLLFKLCVETNMMMHVIAAHFKDDIGDLRALRGYATDEVKHVWAHQLRQRSQNPKLTGGLMAKLIFISPYLKGNRNSAQPANHVRYISTRDGVQTFE